MDEGSSKMLQANGESLKDVALFYRYPRFSGIVSYNLLTVGTLIHRYGFGIDPFNALSKASFLEQHLSKG